MAIEPPRLDSFDGDGVAVVFGASGGIGAALMDALRQAQHFRHVLGFSRNGGAMPFDLADEQSLAAAAASVAAAGTVRLAIDATGLLAQPGARPEKSWRELDAQGLAQAFATNTIGPALLMKHLLPRLPRTGKAAFATLSARVGSIGDNRLGGWYAYRASKAALNQIVRTAAIELARRAPEALCVALHPGTVSTRLSMPFLPPGATAQEPAQAAAHLLTVLETLSPSDTGGFFDWRGAAVPW